MEKSMRKTKKEKMLEEKNLNAEIRARLMEQFTKGMSYGIHAFCGVIYKKATDETVYPEDRLKNIIDFLERSKGVLENKPDLSDNQEENGK